MRITQGTAEAHGIGCQLMRSNSNMKQAAKVHTPETEAAHLGNETVP